ncbi:Uu.00g029510.m01.CDS01 [Anthostomella pinea]|uniref:Uu.00g029510.m01.CDS01 n=1 Tax=Anthostomella pinea TaxID=933095 RepID=A0AAI8V864_9PEZI|nr:Uu.00g029510.m01.CDS01 [Anthostomella pinea]
MSAVRPLEQIKRETKVAYRAPHLRKHNLTGTDLIDSLDNIGIGGAYHHEGPYDATLASRNKDERFAPVAAVKTTNMEALRATPYEHIQDSLRKHMPLQGTSTIPPGMPDLRGLPMEYEEGVDVMRESDAYGGALGRYEHVQYHPDDLKGKGEPSYTIERDLKERKRHQKSMSSGTNGNGNNTAVYEMQPTGHRREDSSTSTGKDGGVATVRQRRYSTDSAAAGPSSPPSASVGRSNTSSGKRLSGGLKQRFGSIRRHHKHSNSNEDSLI